MSGGGGSGDVLTFKVFGGTASPTKATHNTLWANTDHEITRYVFSATEPNNPIEGMLWITIGDTSVMKHSSAVGDDWIIVYPMTAKQYIDGIWLEVVIKSYQYGEWKTFITYVYKNGIEYTDVAKFVASGGEDNIQFNATDITVRQHNVKTAHGRWATTGKVDLSKFSTLVMKLSGQTPYGGMCGFGVAPSAPTGTNPSTSAFTSLRTAGSNQERFEGVYTCDISAVNSGYIFFGGAKTETGVDSGGGSITMTECYLY
jgi:hypothetical protein